MTILEFLADLVRSLAWPATAMWIVFLLRDPLKGLIPLLHRLKYKDLELEFDRKLEAAKAEAEGVVEFREAPGLLPPGQSAFIERIATLAATSPQAAVLEAWRGVESRAADFARRRGYIGEKIYHRTPANLIRALRRSSEVDPSLLSLLDDLRALRNRAAHAPDFAVSMDSVLEYAFLAEQVIDYFGQK